MEDKNKKDDNWELDDEVKPKEAKTYGDPIVELIE